MLNNQTKQITKFDLQQKKQQEYKRKVFDTVEI